MRLELALPELPPHLHSGEVELISDGQAFNQLWLHKEASIKTQDRVSVASRLGT